MTDLERLVQLDRDMAKLGNRLNSHDRQLTELNTDFQLVCISITAIHSLVKSIIESLSMDELKRKSEFISASLKAAQEGRQ